jgi:hypothetical protein
MATELELKKKRLRLLELQKIQRARSGVAPAPTEQEFAREGEGEDFVEGLAVSGMNTYYGIKDLVSDLDDGDRANLREWQRDAGQSGAGTAGEIIGDVGQMAATGGGISAAVKGGLKLATKLFGRSGGAVANTAAQGGGLTKDLASVGAVEGVQLPDYGETRTGNAGSGMAFGLGGAGLAKAVKVAGTGINKSKAGQQLLDEGYPLTPAQAAPEGTGIEGIENTLKLLPGTAKGALNAQNKAKDEVMYRLVGQMNPSRITLKGDMNNRMAQLKKAYDKEYGKVWDTAAKPTPDQFATLKMQLDDIARYTDPANEGSIKRLVISAAKLQDDFTSKGLKNLDHKVKKMRGDYDLKQEFRAVSNTLRSTLPLKSQKKLDRVDKNYGGYLVGRRAVGKSNDTTGMFTPKEAWDSMKSVGGEGRNAVGASPLRGPIGRAVDTVGKKNEAFFPSWRKAVATKVPSPQPVMDYGGRAVLGETALQKLIAKKAEQANPITSVLRNLGARPAFVAGADTGE